MNEWLVFSGDTMTIYSYNGYLSKAEGQIMDDAREEGMAIKIINVRR